LGSDRIIPSHSFTRSELWSRLLLSQGKQENEESSLDPGLALIRRHCVSTNNACTNQERDRQRALQEALTFHQRNCIAAVEAMPTDKFNYKPTLNQMTFGQPFVRIVETNPSPNWLPASRFWGT
jgi:hypothetical protein